MKSRDSSAKRIFKWSWLCRVLSRTTLLDVQAPYDVAGEQLSFLVTNIRFLKVHVTNNGKVSVQRDINPFKEY